MSIKFLPSEFLKKAAPKQLVEKLVTKDLTLNKAAVKTLARGGFKKKKLETAALEVIKSYKKRYRKEKKAGSSASAALKDTLNDKKLMVSRVQGEIVYQVHKQIRDEYRGEYYEWLPSDAKEPDPLHQLKYGLVFRIGKGEMPGDRFGCRCGMNILVDATELEL